RASGRRRDHGAWVRRLRGLGRGHGEDDRGLPVRVRLPLLRSVAEVRQPQRHARQGRRARALAAHAGFAMRRRYIAVPAPSAAIAAAIAWWSPWSTPPDVIAGARQAFGTQREVHVLASLG